MKFDDILKEIGEFGSYQKRVFFFVSLPCASAGMFMVMSVILLAEPEHRCKIPGLDNDTYDVQSESHLSLVNSTIPGGGEDHAYDQCRMYTGVNLTYDNENRPINASTTACTEWVYDSSVFKNTFTKQMNLVCMDNLRVSDAETTFYFGNLVGVLGFGQLSDIIGRKKTLYINVWILLTSSIGLAFAKDFYVFAVLMFVVGTSVHGTWMTAYVIGMELVGPSKRVWTGCLAQLVGSLGSLYLSLMAYLLRDWKWLELSIGLPTCVFVAYWWILPDSPRWLLSKGRRTEALAILQATARGNGTELSEEMMDVEQDDDDVGADRKSGLWKLFSTKTLAFRTIIVCINWFIVSMSFYGVVLNVGNLGGDFYLNFFLLAVVELPVKLFSLMLLDRVGRKKMYIAFMVTGGLSCIGTIFPVLYGTGQQRHVLLVTLALVGKMGVAGGFETLYVLSAELFPTVLRNAGMGSSSAFARAGSMVAPFIARTANLSSSKADQAIPLTVFGVASFGAGLLCLLLPETAHKRLPDTVEDTTNFTRSCNNDEETLSESIKKGGSS